MKRAKSLIFLFVVAIVLTTLASCKRGGYGCPYDFKAKMSVIK